MKSLEKIPGVPKVTCLCATKGRYELLRSVVSYFLLQDYPNKELLIFNNHPVPINLSEFLIKQCNIRVINAGELKSIHDVYNTALTHIDNLTEFVAIWDDDDIYFPWHLSTGIEFLCKGTHWAWQPREQLLIDDHLEFYPKIGAHRNACEGSTIAKHSLLKKYGFGPGEHAVQLQHPHPAWTNEILYNLGGLGHSSWEDNSYAYFWSDKNRHKPFYTHLSCGNNKGTQNSDTGKERPLYPGPTYFEYIIKNLHLKSYDQEYTSSEKQKVINRINKYNWRFYEERKLFTFWDGKVPYFVEACIHTMENNSNCIFELWDSKKLKKEFKDIPPEYDNLCVEFKADYARNRILYERGGMWLDADMLVVGDLYDGFMKHTWDHDSVMATEDPNHTWITINCGALCARPQSITFKRALRYINKIIKGHTVHWGDILNHGTKIAVRDTASTHNVKYVDKDVVTLEIVQSPLGGFDTLYKSPTIPLDHVITKNTKVVTLHGSQIRHEVAKMPDEYLLQRMINHYTDDTFKSIDYRGFKFITCDDFKSSISLSACEPFEEEINFISEYCSPSWWSRGDVYLDVGAHHGTWSLPLSRVFNHVHAFEACNENKNILEQNILNNNINNIYIRNIAVGEADGKAFVSQHAPHNSGCFVTCDSGDEAVDQKKLDSFDLGHIAFLKIDVEGSELNVLKGAKKLIQNNKPLICVEINELSEINFGIQPTSLLDYLDHLGYKKVFEWGCNNYFAYNPLQLVVNKSKENFMLQCDQKNGWYGWSEIWKNCRSQQHPGSYFALYDFLKRNNFECLIEIGTGEGGLTKFLCTMLPNTHIISLDPAPRYDKNDEINEKYNNLHLWEKDCFADEIIKKLKHETANKKTCWMLDGGHKNREFNTFVKIAKKDDFLMVHDFARNAQKHKEIYIENKRWCWHESGFEDVLNLEQAEWAGEELLEQCLWGTYKKL